MSKEEKRGRGRPKLPPEERKSEGYHIKFTPEERRKIRAYTTKRNITLTSLIREILETVIKEEENV